jgi:hypothetical protein
MAEKKDFNQDLERITEMAKMAEGINLDEIKVGESYKITTHNTEYLLERREDGFYLSGHEKFCPTPRKVIIGGSTMGGHAIISNAIKIGMGIEIDSITGYDMQGDRIVTSKVDEIEKVE